MNLTVNGDPMDVAASNPTVADVVSQLKLNPAHIVAEHNGEVLSSERFGTPVYDGDKLELVRFMGGGAITAPDHFETQWDNIAKSSPKENMAYDAQLLETLSDSTRVFRLYQWPSPGITYSYKQTLPETLQSQANSSRITGGGVVFHETGDGLFTAIGWLTDPMFPKRLKDKMAFFSDQLHDAFLKIEIPLDANESEGPIDRDYCKQYPNPFELSLNGEKIVALTLRRFKDRFIMQGILHLHSIDSNVSWQALSEAIQSSFTGLKTTIEEETEAPSNL